MYLSIVEGKNHFPNTSPRMASLGAGFYEEIIAPPPGPLPNHFEELKKKRSACGLGPADLA